MNQLLIYITDIGDSAVLTAMALLSMGWFALRGERRVALRFGASFFGASCAIAVLKILVIGCGHPLTIRFGLRSPSGHAALSAALFGGLALLARRSLLRLTAFAVEAVAFLLAASIAVSRVMLGFHSVAEIIVGLLVGAACAVLACGRAPALERCTLCVLPFAVLVPLIVLHGVRLPVEGLIEAISIRLHTHVSICG